MLYTDIFFELKRVLDIDPDDHSEDVKILLFDDWASSIIDECLNRPIALKSRTEYPRPTNTPKLCLAARPVYATPTIRVWEDEGSLYGQSDDPFPSDSELTWGDDFGLQIDQEDGRSRSGILVKKSGIWHKPTRRKLGQLSTGYVEGFGSIKVTYTGGYSLDTLPGVFRVAADQLVSRLLYLFPHGMELAGDSYEDKALSFTQERKGWLLSMVKPMLYVYRNWSFA